MTALPEHEILSLAARVRLAIFDVDGVLTDGRLILGPDGEEFKSFNVRDGHGLVMLRDSGVVLAIISGRESPAVERRMRELGVEHIYQGRRDKVAVLDALLSELGIEEHEVCYVGDDLPDVAIMHRIGLPVAVADAHPKTAEAALWRTAASGGRGAVREVCELIMRARHTLDAAFRSHGAAPS